MEIRIKTEDEFRSNLVKIEIRTDPLDAIEVVNRLLGRPSLSEAEIEYAREADELAKKVKGLNQENERLREALSVSNQRVVDIQEKADAEYGRAEANKGWAERAELRAEKAEMVNKNLIRDHGQTLKDVTDRLADARREASETAKKVEGLKDRLAEVRVQRDAALKTVRKVRDEANCLVPNVSTILDIVSQ